MSDTNLDPRAICNAMLDRTHAPVTNLALQKLLYFAHGFYLVRFKKPLVMGNFEAWQYGPVHPASYAAFKRAGGNPIDFRATAFDVLTGQQKTIPAIEDANVLSTVNIVMRDFGQMSAATLVRLSHIDRGPWHAVMQASENSVNLGLRIDNDLIAARFGHHKLCVDDMLTEGCPIEDSPFPIEESSFAA